jgi:putative membrane protein
VPPVWTLCRQELVIRLDENVSRLTDAVSSCERILNTPIPLSYTRHTARFLMVGPSVFHTT